MGCKLIRLDSGFLPKWKAKLIKEGLIAQEIYSTIRSGGQPAVGGGCWGLMEINWWGFSAHLSSVFFLVGKMSMWMKLHSTIPFISHPSKFIATMRGKQPRWHSEGCGLAQEFSYPSGHLYNLKINVWLPPGALSWWVQASLCCVLPLLPWKALWGTVYSDRVRPPELSFWLGPLGTALIRITGTWLEARRSVFCSLLWWSQSVMWVFGIFFPFKFYIKKLSDYEHYFFCWLFH